MVDKPSCIACDESISSPGEKINFCHWFWPFFVNLIFGNFCHFWPILTHPLTPTIFFYGRKALFRSAVKNLCPYQVKKIMFLHYFFPLLDNLIFDRFWSFLVIFSPSWPLLPSFSFFYGRSPFLGSNVMNLRPHPGRNLFFNIIFGPPFWKPHFWSFLVIFSPLCPWLPIFSFFYCR